MKMIRHLFIILALSISFKVLGVYKSNSFEPVCCNGSSFSLSVDALYWQVIETPVWCYTVTGESAQNPQIRDDKTLSFDFRPGFRLNLSYQSAYNDFDIRSSYTSYYTSYNAQVSNSWVTPTFLPPRVLLSHDFFDTATINWAVKFNVIDLDIGSTFINSPLLKIRPFIGLKGGWVFQNINGLWQNPKINGVRVAIDDYERLTNNFYGVGPKIGFCNQWSIIDNRTYKLGFNTDFQAAYLLGHWKLTDYVTTNQPGVQGASTQMGNRHFGSFVFQGQISLAASYLVSSGKYRLTAAIGYEVQDWLNQYQVLDDLAGANNLSLILQGITLNLGLDF